MIVGIPREIKVDENRVALTPAGVGALCAHGHSVLVERGAGVGSGLDDRAFRAAGARIMPSAAALWRAANLILKVKELLPAEFPYLRPDLIVFTYLHLAANPELARALLASRSSALGYETVQLEDRSLPLLAPMSEVAGRLAIQAGAWCLQAQNGGRGVLLSGASGVRPGRVLVLGAGIAGANASQVAVGVGAEVTVMDISAPRLRYLHDILGGHLNTLMSNRAALEEEISQADLVIGAVLVPGARAPRLITRAMVARMKPGAALVDLSIDQGGTSETSRPTTHEQPIYRYHDVVHYCVTNMPAAVPHTSTYALTNATLSYALEIADQGVLKACQQNQALRAGLNIFDGHVVHPAVAQALGVEPRSPWS
ncbi:MAG TPA: alanine dehydrogenase [Candidatus Binataceae bacterium]|nr:alanine dehydrogenase [Candidatus Binataceae bacterium]